MNRNIVFSNLVWRFFERVGAQGVTFLVSIVLARLLDPETYGVIALVTVFTSILQVFIDAGMGRALIQKKDADDADFSTVFWFNISFSILIYVGMFAAAPLIASFYRVNDLIPVIRVQSLVLILSGVKNVQQAYVSRKMLFKKFFFATLGGTIGAAGIGIGMAYCSFGVWALVAQYLFNQIVDTIILWLTVRWRPQFYFSFDRLRILFNYGWKLLVSAILDTGYRNIRTLLIGKLYTASELAYYNRGHQFPNFIITNINSSIDSVLLPAMSKRQDDSSQIKSMLRKSIVTSTYIMAPMMMGLAACSESLVKVVLTDKWILCVPFLRIFCITYMFIPIHSSNLNAINAMGRSDLFMKLEIIKKIFEFTVLVLVMNKGVLAIAYSLFIIEIPNQFINAYPNKKLLNYSYKEQIKDVFPGIFLAICMGIIVYSINYFRVNEMIMLLIQIDRKSVV